MTKPRTGSPGRPTRAGVSVETRRQGDAERHSYQSLDGETILFRDLVHLHYLPSVSDAAPNTRKNTASHLGDGTGIPVRKGHYAERAARTGLLYAFGGLAIGAIGPNEVRQWMSQMSIDGYDFDTIRAKGVQAAAPWLEDGYLANRSHAVDPIRYHWFNQQVFGEIEFLTFIGSGL